MKNTILRVKRELEKNPGNITFGKINEGNSLIIERGVYFDFLRNADGLRAGAIDLWGYKDLIRNQYMVQDKKMDIFWSNSLYSIDVKKRVR